VSTSWSRCARSDTGQKAEGEGRRQRDQPLKVREAFATRLLQCGIVNDVVNVLSSTRAITTIDPSSFDFPANYVVLNFASSPPLATSAALFKTVGRIDPGLFATDTSGYTQFGRAYLSLQSDVPLQSHRALGRIRAFHLRVTREVLRRLESSDQRSAGVAVSSFDCR
jgi:hypothetical protein